jgi:hypothetical protein
LLHDYPQKSLFVKFQYVINWHGYCFFKLKPFKEDIKMKRLMKKLEDMMIAITFAEAGEYESAREAMGEKLTEERETAVETAPEIA